jgi:tRNA threonylcarbamoyladenosine biosynthesis protein TsaE
MDFEIMSNSAQQTIELGRRFGALLKGGEIVGICGVLGSGKTHLIKGIAAGAGAQDGGRVSSPTFVIVKEYVGRLDIYHVDAYRLESIAEFEMIGFDELCYPESVVLIEWADKIESVLKAVDYIRIEIYHRGQNRREIHVKNAPDYVNL